MFRKFIKNYYKLLDEKLENGTVVVLIIALLIVAVALITQDANAYSKSKVNLQEYSIVEINWTKYKMNLIK